MGSLAVEIAHVRAGQGRAADMVAALRPVRLVVAVSDVDDVLVVSRDGLSWVCAFTSLEEYARFAAARGDGAAELAYATVSGARLLDRWLPALPGAVGLAVDPGSAHPMLLPPGVWT